MTAPSAPEGKAGKNGTDGKNGKNGTDVPAEAEQHSWWVRLHPWARRSIRASIAFVVTGLVAVVGGVLTADHEGSLGPHIAEYSMTLNHEITVNMGPLGSLILDSPLPLGLGVDVLVERIPDELSIGGEEVPAGPGDAIAGLTEDLNSYVQFFTDPATTIRTAAFGLASNAVLRTFLYWSILLTVIMLSRLTAHGLFRNAVASAWRRPDIRAVTIGLVLALAVAPAVSVTKGSAGVGHTSSVLANTPLADARITGRLGELIDHYGQVVIDAINKNSEFYDVVEANLRDAYAADSAPHAPRTPPLPAPTMSPDASPAPGDGASEATSRAAASPTATPEPTGDDLGGPTGAADGSGDGDRTGDEETPPGTAGPDGNRAVDEEDVATIVIVSDLHCNVGMGKVIGAAAQEAEADLIVNLGDTVMGGTAVEAICVNAFADGFGDLPVVVADGNHDSDVTADQERGHGWTVLDGKPVVIEGIRFLGDTDPTLTSLGAPTRQVGPETIPEIGDRLRDEACELAAGGDPVDMLLMHNPRGTEAALKSGCVPLALAGHYHRRIGPWQRGLGVQYVSSSSGGATYKVPTIGPLNAPATITVMRWDRATHTPLSFRTIIADPDQSVDLSPWFAFPARPDHEVELEWPAPGQGPWS
ncbi:hypothetical protein GCG21_06905 [Pseudactinotalea sp. HY160]|uniref:metallophosphoesterase n=1 Tax=Pseudactinotalea sp. HY160 TaxID=2654490 RepID=UPI00128B34EF|nr:metallophosphoesterase [Pseudactinotalea sp. HY160]MPV49738.1 hypothetical protein [Pseudactinotalea sp. HY160]